MIKLESIYEGSTFYEEEIAFFEIDQAGVKSPMLLTGADVLMHIKKDDDIYATYSTTNNKLVIDENKIIIPEHIPTLTFGKYQFDFNIIFSETIKHTGMAPGEWEILNPKTKR